MSVPAARSLRVGFSSPSPARAVSLGSPPPEATRGPPGLCLLLFLGLRRALRAPVSALDPGRALSDPPPRPGRPRSVSAASGYSGPPPGSSHPRPPPRTELSPEVPPGSFPPLPNSRPPASLLLCRAPCSSGRACVLPEPWSLGALNRSLSSGAASSTSP